MATQTQIAAVQQLYIGYLGRAADKAGLDFWTNAVATGVSTLESVATGFTLSNEYKAAFGGLTNDALVEKVYTSVLGRASDTAGKAFWVDALAKGTVTADKLVATFIGALSAPDQTIINNKTFVAQTYTDTVGADFNADAAAAIIANVDGTAASVSAALNDLNTGALAGQVPGLGLINKLADANTAQAQFETANKAALDKLADTLKVDVAEGTTFNTELTNVYKEAKDARTHLVDSDGVAITTTASTSVLTAQAGDAAKATAAAYAALDTAGKAKADAYVSAVKAANAIEGAKDADVVAVKAGLGADVKFTGDSAATPAVVGAVTKIDAAITAVDTNFDASTDSITNAAGLYDYYTAGTTTAEARAAIDGVLKDVPYFSTFKATAVIDSADKVAEQKITDAGADSSFTTKYVAQADAEATLAYAKAADANVEAAKALVDSYKVKTDAVADAKSDISDFNTAHAKVAATHDIASSTAGTDDVKDVFYFADKVTTDSDFSFAAKSFGAGDSIVLGDSLTFNGGALTAGDNNKAEFFLVQNGKDTLLVLENKAFGSSEVKIDANNAVTSHADTAVITLTGVAVTDLSVHNGVISHAAAVA